MNLKEILNAVLTESGFLEKSSFGTSADVDDKQMVAIANRMANSITDFYKWPALRKEFTVLMTSATEYPLPADWGELVPDSVWETDGSRRVELPTPDGRWYMYKFSAYSDGGTLRARFTGDSIEVYDVQPGEEFKMEYISNSAITDSGGTPKDRFDSDTDLWLLDDEVLIRGIQWKWGHAKMMPQYQEWKMDFQQAMNEEIGRVTGGRTVGGRSSDKSFIESRSPYYPLYR